MKITGIETFLLQVGPRPPRPGSPPEMTTGEASFRGSRNWLFVKVSTDAGVHGVGECSGWPRVIETALKDYASILVGLDPTHIDHLWHRLFIASMGHGVLGTVGGGALSGIEMALWDIKGKVLDTPVWNLLGGKFRDRIRIYAHAKTPQAAQIQMQRGIKAFKISSTGRFDVEKLAAIREAVGAEVDLMVDVHGPSWMTTKDAILLGRSLEPYNLLFYEDPIAPENLDALARIQQAVDIPIAAGERVSTLWGARPYLERELVDVIQPDTGRAGGIGQMRKIAAMAEAHYISMAPHSGSLGPVAEVAALHLMASIPNALMLERIEDDWPGRYQVVTPAVEVEDGHIRVPDAPGLGIDLVEDEIRKYPSVRNVADMPPDDGWAYEPGTVDECVYFQHRLRRVRGFPR